MQTKRCSTCKETKPVSEYYKHKESKDGLRASCKPCIRERVRRYQESNREKVKERNRRYQEANRDKKAEYNRRYYEANKKELLEWQRRYYKANKEERDEYNRRWKRENRDQVRRGINECTSKANDRSLEVAHRQGLPWEDWEDEFIIADNGLTLYQKAVKLERSLFSLKGRRCRVIKRNLVTS